MAKDFGSVRRRIAFDTDTWFAFDRLAKDRMVSVQELADEAFRDLLKKHGRPTDLRSALKQSAREIAANQNKPAAPRRKK
jgi:hypothetical protein